MSNSTKLQIFGPVAVIAMIVGAELAVMMLAVWPSSVIAWYLNLEIFNVFQRGYYVLSGLNSIPYFQLVFVALPILMVLFPGLMLRHRMLVALATHLSFIYAFFIAIAWYITSQTTMPSASLMQPQSRAYAILSLPLPNLTATPQLLIMTALLIMTVISCAASHFVYLRAVRRAR